MSFQTPFEIAQSQLLGLRISSVEARQATGKVYPFFDGGGSTRFLVIDTPTAPGDLGRGGPWVVEEFPLEIRMRKAIYPRPITRYRPLHGLEEEELSGLHHLDVQDELSARPLLPANIVAALAAGNLHRRVLEGESLRDLYFTLDLRRVRGGVLRAGLFLRKRLELAALQAFIAESGGVSA